MGNNLLWFMPLLVALVFLAGIAWFLYGLYRMRIPKQYKCILALFAIILAGFTVFHTIDISGHGTESRYVFGYCLKFIGYYLSDFANGLEDFGTILMRNP